jgi:hypothetical protein
MSGDQRHPPQPTEHAHHHHHQHEPLLDTHSMLVQEGALACGFKDVIAGSARGIAQVVSGHPLDTIKVRLQTQPLLTVRATAHTLKYSGPFDCLAKTFAEEGVCALPTEWHTQLLSLSTLCASDGVLVNVAVARILQRSSISVVGLCHVQCHVVSCVWTGQAHLWHGQGWYATMSRQIDIERQRDRERERERLYVRMNEHQSVVVCAALEGRVQGSESLQLWKWVQVGGSTGAAAALIEGPIDVAKSKMQVQYQLNVAQGADRVSFTRYHVCVLPSR